MVLGLELSKTRGKSNRTLETKRRALATEIHRQEFIETIVQ